MDTNELMNVLESLLGPAVAGINTPTQRARGPRLTSPPLPGPVQHGSVTALLSAEMPVGLAVLNASTLAVNRANAPFLALIGPWLTEPDVLGRPLQQVAPGLANSEVEAAFLRVGQTGKPFSAIVQESTPTGPIYRRCTLSAIRGADGGFDELLLTMLDVSDQIEDRHRAELEAQRAAEKAARVEEQAARASVRSAALEAFARANDVTDALGRVAERTAESLGDCCAVFLLTEDDTLQMATLYHRDRGLGFKLRGVYAEHPQRLVEEGVIGRVVLTGAELLVARWSTSDSASEQSAFRTATEGAHVESLMCVPLRESAQALGALLLFSTSHAYGGSGRTYNGADLHFLQELADQIAQAVHSAHLRDALLVAQAENAALLEASKEGIAIYDVQGRLRHLNAVGRHLLMRPQAAGQSPESMLVGGTPRRTFLASDGRPLAAEQLPWARALRGERVGGAAPEGLLVAWEGGARRTLWVRTTPITDATGGVIEVVVSLADAAHAPAESHMGEASHEGASAASPERMPKAAAPKVLDPSLGPTAPALAPTTLLPQREPHGPTQLAPVQQNSCDLAEVCARVARTHDRAQGRRLEIRLPRRQVNVAGDESLMLEATSALISSAAEALPASVPIHIAVWIERAQDEQRKGPSALIPPAIDVSQLNTIRLKPREASELSSFVPPTRAVGGGSGGTQASVAVVRACSPGLGAPSEEDMLLPIVEPPDFAQCRALVAQVGGRAWARLDPLLGPTYSFSVPLVEPR